MGWLLYQAGMLMLLTGVAPVLLLRRGRHYLPTLRGRLGLNPAVAPAPRLWVHAVSVGEVGVAATLIRALPASTELVLTTVTPTGQAVARRSIAADRVAYLPFDLGFAVRRFLDAYTPSALVLVEGDLWPLLLARVKQRSLPVVVVNGRVSDRGFARLRRLRRWVRPILQPVDLFGVQTEIDRDRLLELGVAADRVTGDRQPQVREPGAAESRGARGGGARRRRRAPDPGGGIHHGGRGGGRARRLRRGRSRARSPGAGSPASRAFGRGARPDRGAPVERGSTQPARRSRRRRRRAERVDVLLLDTMGELASLYRLATAVFIGGTLVPSGGHNPLEAARFGAPIAAGPSMHNFAEMAARFDARSAWRRVADARELGIGVESLARRSDRRARRRRARGRRAGREPRRARAHARAAASALDPVRPDELGAGRAAAAPARDTVDVALGRAARAPPSRATPVARAGCPRR